MNLMQDKWITVQRKKGEIEKIAPSQITDGVNSDNPIIEIVTPRPDFQGALYQFLIGLFQTVYAPKDENEWEDKFNSPPNPEELKKETDKIAFAFDLFGEKVRFMQDISLDSDANTANISALLIESPGENTIKENKDFFTKRGSVEKICNHCAASALFTLQTNSPSGGQGHLTSIRGGGPITTILKFNSTKKEDQELHTLWSDIWINVLPKDCFSQEPKKEKNYENVFPWITNKYYKQNSKGSKTTINDLNPLSVYWSYPRRIQLQQSKENIHCDVCNIESDISVKSYLVKGYGLDYGGGSWIHPLSPYYFTKDKELGETWLPFHPQPGGIIYNQWMSFVYGKKDKDKNAKVLSYYFENRKFPEEQTRVWAFGFDMDNMKARNWYESLIPIYSIDPKFIDKYESEISKILQAATQVANNLQTKVKDAWFNQDQKPKGDFDYLKISFFKATETKFYNLAKTIRDNLGKEFPFNNEAKEEWLKYLNEESLKVFELYVESGSVEFENLKRIVEARKSLISWNLGDKIRNDFGLPIKDKPAAKKKANNNIGAIKK
ncbi:CRISPR-associated protein CasA/Cse1 [Leptospira ryugenii]|uniref:CRISPR-associated protein CasA/Cse1 n=1 Tax=Leptospira ryugenii TaxID=1917863 RepID=A0A2P2E1G8_9LEPT|nr:type I-E CRISPR-associated protein Cse1/CasA [Leptospira ryugenii]GBF50738.1 CRISPR-associated protein CasA/Cse1 [Leptospira ryugenii]